MERKNFTVNRIQRKGEGLIINFTTLHDVGEAIFEEKDNKESDRCPDDLFIEDLNSLKQYVSKIINYGKIKTVLGDVKFGADADQSKYLTRLINDYMSKIVINGVQLWSTVDVVTACRINFSLEGFSGQNMDCKTYKIDVSESNIHDFEEELKEKCQQLVNHSFEYLFENKGGQGTLGLEQK